MGSSKKPFDIEATKKKLLEHYQRFVQLQKDGRSKESLFELQKTLECISDLINYSTGTLSYTLKNFANLSPTQKEKIQNIFLTYLAKKYPEKNIVLKGSNSLH